MKTQERKIPWLRLIGLVVLALLLWQLDITAIAQTLQSVNLLLVAVAVGLNPPMLFLKSLRWQALLRAQNIHYTTYKAYLAYLGSIFIGLFTPGRLGEFVKALHVSKDCGVSNAKAFSSVLVDRLFDLYLLLLVGGTALLSLTIISVEDSLLALIASMVCLIVPLVVFLNEHLFLRIQNIGKRLGSIGARLFAQDSWLLEIRRGMQQLTWQWLSLGSLLTIIAYILFFSQCYLLAVALELDATFIQVSFAVALGSLITLLPISISGLGTREATIIATLGVAGITAENALSFSLLVFVTFYIAGALIGVVAWWMKPLQISFHKKYL